MKELLKREEWDFSPGRVADDELWTCLLYEYAREHPFILDLARRVDVYEKERWERISRNVEEDREKRARGEKIENVTDNSSATFFKEIWAQLNRVKICHPYTNHQFRCAILHGWFPHEASPWQLLTADQKSAFSSSCLEKSAFARGGELSVMDVADTCKKQLEKIDAAEKKEEERLRKQFGPCRVDWPKMKTWQPAFASVIDPFGVERTVVRIDWTRFTNRQIKDAAAEWIQQNRPPSIPEPGGKGTGKEHDARAWLNALGVVRAYRFCTYREMSIKAPEFLKSWKRSCTGDLEKEFGRMRRLFRKQFDVLFPFKMKVEPLSWKTAAQRKKQGK